MATVEERKKLAAEQYLAQHRIRWVVENVTSDLVRFTPSQPHQFISERVNQLLVDAPAAGAKAPAVVEAISRPRVIAVVGGPGSGKGMICAHLAHEMGFTTLAPSELIRKEIREGTETGRKVGELLHGNKTIPKDTINGLIKQKLTSTQAAAAAGEDIAPFALDGFPLDLEQALHFDRNVVEISTVVYLKTSVAAMKQRMSERHAAGVHDDDDPASQVKKIKTFQLQGIPVVEYYRALGRVIEVNADAPAVDVAAEVERQLRK